MTWAPSNAGTKSSRAQIPHRTHHLRRFMNRAARSSNSLPAPPEEAGGLPLSAPGSGFLGLSSYLGVRMG